MAVPVGALDLSLMQNAQDAVRMALQLCPETLLQGLWGTQEKIETALLILPRVTDHLASLLKCRF
jgi:hypothetical protein